MWEGALAGGNSQVGAFPVSPLSQGQGPHPQLPEGACALQPLLSSVLGRLPGSCVQWGSDISLPREHALEFLLTATPWGTGPTHPEAQNTAPGTGGYPLLQSHAAGTHLHHP